MELKLTEMLVILLETPKVALDEDTIWSTKSRIFRPRLLCENTLCFHFL